MTRSANPFLVPVKSRVNYYVVSEEWVRAGIPFPDIEEKIKLQAKGYTTRSGVVHFEGRARRAAILIPHEDDSQTYADLLENNNGEDQETAEINLDDRSTYINQIRKIYEFSEAVLPEQRARVESDFVEPALEPLNSPGTRINWGDLRARSYVLILVDRR